MRWRWIAALALGVAVLSCSPALAARGWESPVPAPDPGGGYPIFTVLGDHHGLLAWDWGPGNDRSVRVATVTATGVSTPVVLDTHGYGRAMASDGAGNATITWVHSSSGGGETEIRARDHFASGTMGPEEVLSSPANGYPGIARNAAGDTVIAYWAQGFVGSDLWARIRPAGQPWGPELMLAQGSISTSAPSVALGQDGTAVVAWGQSMDGVRRDIAAAFSLPDGTWTAPQLLSDPTVDAFYPRLAVDTSGGALAVWNEGQDTSNVDRTVKAAVARADELFAEPVTVGIATSGVPHYAALGAPGDGLIAFEAPSATGDDVSLRVADVDTLAGQVSTATAVGPQSPGSFVVAMQPSGDALMVTASGGSPDLDLHTYRRSPGASFQADGVLQCPAPFPAAVIGASLDNQGHAGVLWVDHIANDQWPRKVHVSFDGPVDQPGPTACPKAASSTPAPYTGAPGTPIRPPTFAPNPASKTLLLGPGRVVMSARRPFLDVRVGCRAACHLRATPQLSVGQFRRSLAAQEHRVAAGQRIRLRIKLDKATVRRVRRALAAKRRALVTLHLVALATGSNDWQRNSSPLRISRR